MDIYIYEYNYNYIIYNCIRYSNSSRYSDMNE